MAKEFALIGHVDNKTVWVATGTFEDMVEQHGNEVASSHEDDYFMVIRVYKSANGAIRTDGHLV